MQPYADTQRLLQAESRWLLKGSQEAGQLTKFYSPELSSSDNQPTCAMEIYEFQA
jgi:hypothetical protein